MVMPQLQQIDLFLSQIFWLVFIFMLVYLFVARYFIPRISKVVDQREEEVKRDISEADKLFNKQYFLEAEVEKMLATARQEAAAMRNLAAEKAEDYLQMQVRTFDKELTKKLSKEEERLSRLKHHLAKEIDEVAVSLSREIVKTLLPPNINVKV